ncbi:MAG: LysM peptidoglycan-binding domain-containing protein, partial [bacterium]|nr:LysM peptidoglycan-binding domain-containing protein [bacterium]
MRNIIKIASVFALATTLLLSLSVFAQDCREWTMDQYNAKMADLQKREADAKTEIAAIEGEIANLQDQIAQADKDIVAEWQEIYGLLETDEAGVSDFGNNLKALESDVDGLAGLSAEDLFQRRKEIDQLEEQLNQMKENNISWLSEMQDQIAVIEGKISQLRASLPKAVFDEYTVIRGDHLWKISGKEDIYADPYQWIRIYTYNRDQIKDPNLIHPEQIFKIQRAAGDNEYLVVKGDFLQKIAGKAEVFG